MDGMTSAPRARQDLDLAPIHRRYVELGEIPVKDLSPIQKHMMFVDIKDLLAEVKSLRAARARSAEPKTISDAEALIENVYDMLRKVEWVRQSAGSHYACPFCGGVSERDGGPGHTDDCEWCAVVNGPDSFASRSAEAPAPDARLLELARQAAMFQHCRWKPGTKRFAASGHDANLATCRHQNCAFIRAALASSSADRTPEDTKT